MSGLLDGNWKVKPSFNKTITSPMMGYGGVGLVVKQWNKTKHKAVLTCPQASPGPREVTDESEDEDAAEAEASQSVSTTPHFNWGSGMGGNCIPASPCDWQILIDWVCLRGKLGLRLAMTFSAKRWNLFDIYFLGLSFWGCCVRMCVCARCVFLSLCLSKRRWVRPNASGLQLIDTQWDLPRFWN